MKYWILFLLLLFPLAGHALTLKERFYKSHPGDYIVTLQAKNYSLLRVHTIKESSLILEEITIPEQEFNPRAMTWREWVKRGVPGNTSWVLYEIDLEKNALVKCFSKKKMALIFPEESDYLFPKFLTLQLRTLGEEDRKKVGPPPQEGPDHRKIWSPILTIDGKTIPKPKYTVLQAKWPDDGTLLASCILEFYLDENRPFPFPYWIEIKSTHYGLKVRAIDSGTGLPSPT